MTAPTQELTDSDIVKLADKLIFTELGEGLVDNPLVFENGGDGGPQRPTSGIVYP